MPVDMFLVRVFKIHCFSCSNVEHHWMRILRHINRKK
uniref:Uncharacterized protein n=1 Tax=Rhizophora mucronata TaxID=61149 RepID=A0A2P2PA97_RHIMU